MNRENKKMNEPHEFVPNLSQRSELISSDEYIALQLTYLLHLLHLGKKESSIKTMKFYNDFYTSTLI